MQSITTLFEQANVWQLGLFSLAIAVLWFLPVILALFFNRKHLKLIAAACVPAGFSFIAWTGVLIWSVTGKVWEKKDA